MKAKKNARERREEARLPYAKKQGPAQPEPEWKKALRQFRAETEPPAKAISGKAGKAGKTVRRDMENEPDAAAYLSLLSQYDMPPERPETDAAAKGKPAKSAGSSGIAAGRQAAGSRLSGPEKQHAAEAEISPEEYLFLLNEYGTPPEERETGSPAKTKPAKSAGSSGITAGRQAAENSLPGPEKQCPAEAELSPEEYLSLLNEYGAPPEEEEATAGKPRPAKAATSRKTAPAKVEELSAEAYLSMLEDCMPPEDEEPAERIRPGKVPARLMDTVNLEAGMPHAEQAIITMERQLSRAAAEGWRVVKLIHGYGSTGKGGVLRGAVRERLPETVKQLHARDWVAGEDFGRFSPLTRQMLNEMPALKQDRDLERGNRGVTLVWLR